MSQVPSQVLPKPNLLCKVIHPPTMGGTKHEIAADTKAEPVELELVEHAQPHKKTANFSMDDAAKLMAEAGHVEATPEDRKRVLRLIDIYVCLPMCITYFAQQVSKEAFGLFVEKPGKVAMWRQTADFSPSCRSVDIHPAVLVFQERTLTFPTA